MDHQDFPKRINQKPWVFGILLAGSLLFLIWVLNTPPGVLGKADAIGYAVCHRIDSRSFHLGERQLPLCVRCSGQFLGALFGVIYLTITEPRRVGTPPRIVILILSFFVIAYAIDGINSYFHLSPMVEMFPSFPRLYKPTNVGRMFTGSGMGFSVGVFLFLAFNRMIWSNYDSRPVMRDQKQLGLGLFLLIILDLLILTEATIILYPLSIVSSLSVVFLLSMVYSLIVSLIFHLENRYSKISQLGIPMMVGFFLAILQLALMDALRYWLTGTWDGFHL